MALDPADHLALAEHLLTIGSEAACRAAVNRAYYACHLTARDQLHGLDARSHPGRRPSHIAVVRAVRDRLDVEAGAQLDDLKRMRELADYVRDSDHPELRLLFARSGVQGWTELADEAVTIAQELLPLLQTIPAAQ